MPVPMDAEFRIPTELRLTDVDLNGHVNHAAYLAYAEAARVRHLGALGVSAPRLVTEGLAVVVLRLEIDYIHELGMEDTVEATSRYIFDGDRTVFGNHGRVLSCGEPAAELHLKLGLLDLKQRRLRKSPAAVLTELAESIPNPNDNSHD